MKEHNDRKARDWGDWNMEKYEQPPSLKELDFSKEDPYEDLPTRQAKGFKSRRKYPKHSWVTNYLKSQIGKSFDEIYSDLKLRFKKDSEFNYPNHIINFTWKNVIVENDSVYYISTYDGHKIELSHRNFYFHNNILCYYNPPKKESKESYIFKDGLYITKYQNIWYVLQRSERWDYFLYLYRNKSWMIRNKIKERLLLLNKNNSFGVQFDILKLYLIDYVPSAWRPLTKKELKKYKLKNH